MISKRALSVDSSGIRRVFDLAAKLENPINLSIGQPDFSASDEVKKRAIRSIEEDRGGYTRTQGIDELRSRIADSHAIPDTHEVFLTAGVSGGLLLSFMVLLDPLDEILIPDPFFCMYRDLALMLNATPVYYDTYPDFKVTAESLERNLSKKTKAIVLNSPGNPTGYAYGNAELASIVEFAKAHNLPVIYDEIYSKFCYDGEHADCLKLYENTIVLNGFSKSAGVPGWRAGYVIAPKELSAQMLKIQQYTLVCTNSIAQYGLGAVFDEDFSQTLDSYRKRRDFIVEALRDKYDFVKPGGAFYMFPRVPFGTSQEFIERCVKKNLLLVPGSVFSTKDTHFRISFSASLSALEQGADIFTPSVRVKWQRICSLR